MTIFGYARVSSVGQNLARQIEQLEKAGVDQEHIFKESKSGKNTKRPKLQEMLDSLHEGDTIIVSDLTRISRSTKDLFKLIDEIKEKGAVLKSLKDTWLDMSKDNPYSNFLLTVMAGVAQLERELMIQRQREGLEIAKKNKVKLGRLKTYHSKHEGMLHAIELYNEREKTVKQICSITKVSRASLYRALKELNNKK